nr:heme NO-binding domain-containing protein [Pseudooceanicola onchidii]
MHGLMMRSIQCFARDTYGQGLWAAVARRAALDVPDFEAMLTYDQRVAEEVIAALTVELGRPRASVLEDIGTYLVSDPNVERLRRLLRFAGISFEDFLQSLEDLPGRARLAVSDLILPRLTLQALPGGRYILRIDGDPPGFAHVMVGILRAMADDYGALVMLDHHGQRDGVDEIAITLVEAAFAEGRQFVLGDHAG